jgi:excisionase family DNA binding protein
MSTVLKLEEAAEFLKVHPSTAYRLIKKHHIPAFKIGSDWRFNQESLERWIKEREAADGLDPLLG